MSTVKTAVSPLTTARKAKKYGHVSLSHALAATGKVVLTGKEIAALEATGTAKEIKPVLDALKALPAKPGRFWDILEGRIAPPTKEVAVFAGKDKVALKALSAAPAPAAVAKPSDLI